ncbi:hypothetical protein [Thermosulfurimonas dismutans]|uniref:DUF2281 domain-containing protein n=1 Tax=Thermosulfurimonas dismutans TaxID=999894 RepID=A0A179D321_9BACT|nr:hypothetical protein [Thermosulfurimonas dismutans]OAQ20028.1 hypothetical protein TDIS_1847 [Thermosulfurimonas dismutans]
MQVHEIIENIKKLPENDLKILLEWIEDFEQELWDKEFERDVKLGKLEKLAEQAIKDFRAGICQPLFLERI